MPDAIVASRHINLRRKPKTEYAAAFYDRLDKIQAEVEGVETRRRRSKDVARRFRECLRAICLDLYDALCTDETMETGVCRDHNRFSNNAAYPEFATARQFTQALDGLINTGYVELRDVGREWTGISTRVRGTSKLYEALNFGKASRSATIDAADPIRLRLKVMGVKRRAAFEDTEMTREWRKNLARINAHTRSFSIDLSNRAVPLKEIEAARQAKEANDAAEEGRPICYQRLDLRKVDLHRVFNAVTWDAGGRFYGGWWQTVPGRYRSLITINGTPTCEFDYSAIHPRMLYADVGRDLGGADPYACGFANRAVVKRAFNVLLNAKGKPNPTSVPEFSPGETGYSWDGFLEEMKRGFGLLSQFFNQGEGARLQYRDARIAEYVMLQCVAAGVPCLPIHDSFITTEDRVDFLRNTMVRAARLFEKVEIPVRQVGRHEVVPIAVEATRGNVVDPTSLAVSEVY